jgi:O6-methylguanine-DNA--protein-cysteine methyltransferase
LISEIPRRESSGLAEVTLQWTARKMALGWVGAVASPGGIRYLVLPRADRATVESEIADRFGPAALTDGQLSAASGHLDRLFGQLTEYFAGTRSEFDVAIDPVGTDFQRRVWKALLGIP